MRIFFIVNQRLLFPGLFFSILPILQALQDWNSILCKSFCHPWMQRMPKILFIFYLHDLFARIDQHPSAAFLSAVFITAAFSPDLDLFNSRVVCKVQLLFRQLFSVSRLSGLQAIVKSRISQGLPAEVPHLPFLYSLYLFDLNHFLQKIIYGSLLNFNSSFDPV